MDQALTPPARQHPGPLARPPRACPAPEPPAGGGPVAQGPRPNRPKGARGTAPPTTTSPHVTTGPGEQSQSSPDHRPVGAGRAVPRAPDGADHRGKGSPPRALGAPQPPQRGAGLRHQPQRGRRSSPAQRGSWCRTRTTGRRPVARAVPRAPDGATHRGKGSTHPHKARGPNRPKGARGCATSHNVAARHRPEEGIAVAPGPPTGGGRPGAPGGRGRPLTGGPRSEPHPYGGSGRSPRRACRAQHPPPQYRAEE